MLQVNPTNLSGAASVPHKTPLKAPHLNYLLGIKVPFASDSAPLHISCYPGQRFDTSDGAHRKSPFLYKRGNGDPNGPISFTKMSKRDVKRGWRNQFLSIVIFLKSLYNDNAILRNRLMEGP